MISIWNPAPAMEDLDTAPSEEDAYRRADLWTKVRTRGHAFSRVFRPRQLDGKCVDISSNTAETSSCMK
jgi:hypothetical protein